LLLLIIVDRISTQTSTSREQQDCVNMNYQS